MQVGILSMQRIVNYGSVLQSYALKRLIEKKGHAVGFIDIIGDNDNTDELGDRKRLNDYNGYEKNILLYIIHRVTNYIQRKKIRDFQKELLNLDDNKLENYDLCIIGSDEVFNCTQKAEWGFSSQLFGDVKNSKVVVSYAASCGFTVYDSLSEKQKEKVQNAFKNLLLLSVRDENTKEFARYFSNKDISINLDPTLVYSFEDELKGISKKRIIPPKTCLIYAYQNRICNNIEISSIKAFCKEKGLNIVAAGAFQDWVPRQMTLSPFELLKAFEQAEFVITDTFHGAIFSMKYSKRFAIMVRESNSNKLQDLIDRIDVGSHQLKEISDLEKIYNIEDDKTEFNELIKIEEKRTEEYLEKCFNGVKCE